MFLPKLTEKSAYTPTPAGTHVATCIKVLDLGTQSVEWQGEVKHQRKVMLIWELPHETMADGRPFTHSQRYTLSSSEKSTLRKHLEGWRGKRFVDADFGPGGFDIKSVLGKSCSLIVSHVIKGDKVYANTDGIGPVPKGMTVPPTVNPLVYLSLDPAQFDVAAFEGLSDGLKGVIMASPEFTSVEQRLLNASPAAVADDENIPF